MKVYAIYKWVNYQPLLHPPVYSSRERAYEVAQELRRQAALNKEKITYSVDVVEVEE